MPRLGVFSGLDRWNWQVAFPGVFRWWYLRSDSKEEYAYHYEQNPDGLTGVQSEGRRWHEHFTRRRLDIHRR